MLEFYCLFSEHLGGGGVLNSVFTNRVEFGTILEGLRNFGGGWGFEHPKPPLSIRHWPFVVGIINKQINK